MVNFDIVERSYRNTHDRALIVRNKKSYEFFVNIDIYNSSVFSYTINNNEIVKLTIFIDEQLFIKNTFESFYNEGRRDKIPESELIIKNVNILKDTIVNIDWLGWNRREIKEKIKPLYENHELFLLGKWLLKQFHLKEKYNNLCSTTPPEYIKIAEAYRNIKDSEKEKPTNVDHVPKQIISFEPLLDSTELTNTKTNKVFDFRASKS